MMQKRQTFVLVHGSWHGGWCWRRVAEHLRSKNHDVFTPTLTGYGERAHLITRDISLETGIEDILGVFEAEELETVTLVGHSAGAAVVAGVADRIPSSISSIIWFDGLLLRDGESLHTYFNHEQEALYQAAVKAGRIPFPPPPPAVFNVTSESDAAWLARRLTPLPFGIADSPLRLGSALGNGLPCTYLACVNPPHAFVAASQAFARTQTGWRMQELHAGHDAMITDPVAVADALREIAVYKT